VKAQRFTPPYSDEAIVAWIDGEMCRADAESFEARLRSDKLLSGRTAELMKSNQDYQGAFAAVLDEAPLARMHARLGTLSAQPAASAQGVSRRALIAASVSFLALGSTAGYLFRPSSAEADEHAHIRDLEAQYMSLYSAETLVDMDSATPVIQRGLARAAEDLGLPLLASQLRLRGAELKMMRMLRYDSISIAQIAWLSADYGPMALCISPTEQGATTALHQEQRHGMNLVWWHHAGYQFVLIGRNPLPALKGSAQQLYDALA